MTGSAIWDPSWLSTTVQPMSMDGAWRCILTEHFATSLRLVDDVDEAVVLEALLAGEPEPVHRHPQAYAPFNYRPGHASRFRPAHQMGYWYGAHTREAALSEISYWRMQFMLDTAAGSKLEPMQKHSVFQFDVHGYGINLMAEPWVSLRDTWRHGSDYSATHALADAAVNAGVEWLQYESVRAPSSALAVVFTPDVLRGTTDQVDATHESWVCKVSMDRVVWYDENSGESLTWTKGGE